MDPITAAAATAATMGGASGAVGGTASFANALPVLGSLAGQKNREKGSDAATDMAQLGVRWRVKDAQLAGISPLAALGLPLVQPGAGVAVGTRDYESLGQNLSRAAMANSSHPERVAVRMANAQLKNQELQNALLSVQILRESQLPPQMPGANDFGLQLGQGDAVKLQPARITASTPGAPAKSAGVVPDYTFARTSRGGLAVVPSPDVKQLIEDQVIPEAQWSIRNLFPPDSAKPSRDLLPPGAADWRYTLDRGWIPVSLEERVRELSPGLRLPAHLRGRNQRSYSTPKFKSRNEVYRR